MSLKENRELFVGVASPSGESSGKINKRNRSTFVASRTDGVYVRTGIWGGVAVSEGRSIEINFKCCGLELNKCFL